MSKMFENNFSNIVAAYEQNITVGNFLPAVYVVEITNDCTLNCVMCPRSKIKSENIGHMDLELFKYIIDEIKGTAEHILLYFMGEPLMHPQFSELLNIARSGVSGKITISTNAMFLSDDFIRVLINAPVDYVICCIDGWNKEDYGKIRIGGCFDKVTNNVSSLLSLNNNNPRPTIIVKSLNISMTERDASSFNMFWEQKGAIPIVGWVDTWAGQMINLKKYVSTQPYHNLQRQPCADLWFKMIINWRGEVVLCCHNFDYSIKIGEINLQDEKPIQKVWQGYEISSIRNSHIKGDFEKNSLCKNCTEWASIAELNAFIKPCNTNIELIF